MALSMFNPIDELDRMTRQMDQLFNQTFGGTLVPREGSNWFALDMYETDNDLVVKAVLPGVDPSKVNVSLSGDTLTIRADFGQEKENENATYHIRERRYGTFSRSILVPIAVNADQAKAEYENGVLTLTLPKAETVKPKLITVKAK
jgi:HSP20 family protein